MDSQNIKKPHSYANKIITVVSIILTLISLLLLFNYYFAGGQEYEKAMERYAANETEALKISDQLDKESNAVLLENLDKISIPKTKANIEIVNEISRMDKLSEHLKRRNELVRKYSELRLKVFELYRKSIVEDTNKYSNEINEISNETEELRKEIEKIEV